MLQAIVGNGAVPVRCTAASDEASMLANVSWRKSDVQLTAANASCLDIQYGFTVTYSETLKAGHTRVGALNKI